MRPAVLAAILAWVVADDPAQAAEVWGGPARGCIHGAEELPLEGRGYQVLRPARERYFGHPALVRFVRSLAMGVEEAGWDDLLIGDMSLRRGGPMPFGHRSHQNGLDADVWFRPGPLAAADLVDPNPVSMVNGAGPSAGWTAREAGLVRAAASAPEVARVFVNPVLKRALCRSAGEDRAWLRKVRPWRGHDIHFHVRLKCPEDSQGCVDQAPPPPGDGCGKSLDWWFTAAARAPRPAGKKAARPAPPPECRAQ